MYKCMYILYIIYIYVYCVIYNNNDNNDNNNNNLNIDTSNHLLGQKLSPFLPQATKQILLPLQAGQGQGLFWLFFDFQDHNRKYLRADLPTIRADFPTIQVDRFKFGCNLSLRRPQVLQYIYLFFAVYVLVFLSFETKSTPTQIFSHPQFPPSKLPAHPPVVFWYLLHSARIPLSRHE